MAVSEVPPSPSVLPRPCHAFNPENSSPPSSLLPRFSCLQSILKRLLSSDATPQGPFWLLPRQSHHDPFPCLSPGSPLVAGPGPYAEKTPSKNQLNLIKVILMRSMNCHSLPPPKKILYFIQGQKKGIFIEYWFKKVTSL